MAAKDLVVSAAEFVPQSRDLRVLRAAVQGCRGCDLFARATQAVFGEGRRGARVMLVGEQPGDREDVEGKPFVGPAGKLLDRALEDAGIERKQVYVTNAVKHFKWEARGKRRIHDKPNALEIAACRAWLDAEIEAVGPEVVVLMGATAAQGMLGKTFKVTQRRGEWIDGRTLAQAIGAMITATVHPSSILRARDEESRHREYAAFVKDLKNVSRRLGAVKRAA